MKKQNNENSRRILVLGVLLFSVITLTVLPRGIEGSIYILAVAAFSGLMAALIFLGNSIRRIKDIAEQMSDDYQADALHGRSNEQAA